MLAEHPQSPRPSTRSGARTATADAARWRREAQACSEAFARHAGLDAETRALAGLLVELAALAMPGTDAGPSWEQTQPGALAVRLAGSGLSPLCEPFALLWGFFQFLGATGRMDPGRARYVAAYFQTLTELEEGLL